MAHKTSFNIGSTSIGYELPTLRRSAFIHGTLTGKYLNLMDDVIRKIKAEVRVLEFEAWAMEENGAVGTQEKRDAFELISYDKLHEYFSKAEVAPIGTCVIPEDEKFIYWFDPVKLQYMFKTELR